WTGGGDGTNWMDPANWSGNALPGANDDVFIDLPVGNASVQLGGGAQVSIHSFALDENLTLSDSASISLAVGATVSVHGNGTLTLAGGSISGAFTNVAVHGKVNWTGGGLSFLDGELFMYGDGALDISGPNPKSIVNLYIVNEGITTLSGGQITFVRHTW